MKYTQEQLNENTKEQLDEIVGGLQWKPLKGVWKSIIFDDLENKKVITDYHPTSNKEQAWDLITTIFSGYYKTDSGYRFILHGYNLSDQVVIVGNFQLTIAVTIASILHLQESE